MPAMIAAIAGPAIGGIASYMGASKSAKAAKKAAKLQYAQYQQTRADLAPWTQVGGKTQYTLADLMGIESGQPRTAEFGALARGYKTEDYQADPGYAFRLSEGQKALERGAAARSGLLGGAQGKALTRYGQEMGSNEYQRAYDRWQQEQANKFNRLQWLSGTGQSAAAQTGAFGQQAAYGMGQAGQQAANAWAQGYGNIAGMVGQAGQNYLTLDMLRKPERYPGMYGATPMAPPPTTSPSNFWAYGGKSPTLTGVPSYTYPSLG